MMTSSGFGARLDMEIRNPPSAYGATARALHWWMAALIALQVGGGFVLETLPRTPLRGLAFDAHESIGIAVLALLAVRIAWRFTHAVPAEGGPAWQRSVARIAHALLYALMVAVPIVGYAMVDAKGYDVAFFGLPTPDFLAKDETLARRLADTHERLAIGLAVLVALHIVAAAWHRLVLRDDVLARMLPSRTGG
jgi:cytochrome b561